MDGINRCLMLIRMFNSGPRRHGVLDVCVSAERHSPQNSLGRSGAVSHMVLRRMPFGWHTDIMGTEPLRLKDPGQF
eukprot:15142916-Alexandrium_andersonii.AAC.1